MGFSHFALRSTTLCNSLSDGTGAGGFMFVSVPTTGLRDTDGPLGTTATALEFAALGLTDQPILRPQPRLEPCVPHHQTARPRHTRLPRCRVSPGLCPRPPCSLAPPV